MLIYIWTLHIHVCAALQPHFISHRVTVTAAHRDREARPLVLAILLENGRGQDTRQEQRNQLNYTHHFESTG